MRSWMVLVLVLAGFAATLAGCPEANLTGQLQEGKDPQRNTAAARVHNDAGAKLLEAGNFGAAEKEFKAAFAADEFFGPAHNNLGVLYYRQKKLDLAATEFNRAAKYMPKESGPLVGMGMVWEVAGNLPKAAKCYEDALAVNPDDTQATGCLAKAYVRTGRNDQRTRQLLNEIVMKDRRAEWVDWARQRLALFDKTPPPGK